jgi:hypothetical protein
MNEEEGAPAEVPAELPEEAPDAPAPDAPAPAAPASDAASTDGPPTSLVELMDRLVEPPEPAPVPLVPETAGWWVLAALALLLLGWALWRAARRRRAEAYRRAALAELEAAGGDPAATAAILRRAALAAYPRGEVAGRAGGDWVEFLHRTGGFPLEQGPALLAAPYRPGGPHGAAEGPAAGDAAALRDAAERWLRRHRREVP